MARIDILLERMASSGAPKLILAPGAPLQMQRADGSMAQGNILAPDQLQSLIDEILPVEAQDLLHTTGAAHFEYSAPTGRFLIAVKRTSEGLYIEIAPPPSPFATPAAVSATPQAPLPAPPIYTPSPAQGMPQGYASPPGYMPPPPSGYGPPGHNPPVGNDSGSGPNAIVPTQIQGFNWGGFLLSWIWAIGNNAWIGLLGLVPFVGFFVRFWLGFKGNEMAWRNKQWASVDVFRSAQRTWAIVGLVLWLCSGGLFMFSSAVMFPVFARARENARRSACQSQLKQISLGVLMFAQDHGEKFPNQTTAEGWQQDISLYARSTNLWGCPSHPGERVSYEVNPKLANISQAQVADISNTPMVWDKYPDVHLDGRNVAFTDGHIKWFQESAFQSVVKPAADSFTPSR